MIGILEWSTVTPLNLKILKQYDSLNQPLRKFGWLKGLARKVFTIFLKDSPMNKCLPVALSTIFWFDKDWIEDEREHLLKG
jgi:hypothetical protein